MQKKLTLLILIMFNINFYTQVVIKDEIILDEKALENQATDGVGIIMPFYGKVSEYVYSWSIACGSARRELIVDGASYPFGPCWNWECGVGSCFCVSGSYSKLVENVPMGASVDTRLQRCKNWGNPGDPPSWGDMLYYFQLYSATQTKHTYYVYARYTENDNWQLAAYIYLTKTTPPGNCPNAGGNYCDSSSWVQIPDVELVPYPNSNVISKWCSEHPNTMAAFGPAIDHPSNINMGEINESNVIACYNQILQTWQFNLDQNLKIYYRIGICSTNVSNKNLTYINDTTDIEDIPSIDCNIALISFNAHKEYKWYAPTQTYGLAIPDGGYLIKEVILEHENQHKVLYEKFMNDYLFWWGTKINTFRAICSTYTNIFEAEKGGFNMYMYAYSTLSTYFNEAHERFTGAKPENKLRKGRNEKRANNKPEVQNLIIKYVEKLRRHCAK